MVERKYVSWAAGRETRQRDSKELGVARDRLCGWEESREIAEWIK